MESLVTALLAKKKQAFFCLDALLDLKETTDFLRYIPLFILPIIFLIGKMVKNFLMIQNQYNILD